MSDVAASADPTATKPVLEPPPPSRRLPPGPRGLPWIGTAITLARDPLGFILELGHHYGSVSYTRFGPYHVYMLNEPELIEDVLIGKHRLCTKDKSTRDLMPLAGNGLLTSEGEPWRKQRKLASPPLQPKRIASYGATMRECAERAFGALRDGQELDLHALLGQVTLEIVGKTLLGVDATGDAERIARVIELFMQYFERQAYSPEGLLPLFVPTPRRVRMRRAVADLDRIIYPMIARCRANGAQEDHLLARLINARDEDGEPMSDLQLRDEAVTMLLAGHETTALALTYALYLLARHPDAAARLQAEVDGALAAAPSDPMALCTLPYLNAVARETMRLYPPAYVIGREVTEPFTIGGYHVDRGSQLLISQYTLQRDPRFFPEPERWNPERWLDGRGDALPRFAYFPFGGGPRVCIGNHFAMMEIAIVLATFVHALTVQLPAGYQLQPAPLVTLRVQGGLPARVHLR
jgi:cytochrome P450